MGSEVGFAYVSIYPDTSHFQDKLEDELNGMKLSASGQTIGQNLAEGVTNGFSPVTVMLGNLMTHAIEGAVNLFTQNLGRGIERLDTIKNFPRLMSTFGYSTDVAAESVQNIQNHLMGLPGSTDEVLRLVQAISDSTGSLELATSTGLAFNDMLTASGADAYTSMMAMRMFDQMMGGAQFTTMRWMALVSKMPLQMNMVAEAILGTGASAQELGTALQNGEVTMKDVAEAMTELGPQFTVQAKAFSYGVGTAVRNFGNRVVLGIAAILDAIGQFHISNLINDISTGIKDALVFIAGGVEWLRRVFLVSGIGVLMQELGESIKNWFLGIDWEPLKEFARIAIGALHDGLQWLIDNGDVVQSVFVGLVSIAAADWLNKVATAAFAMFNAFMLNPVTGVVTAIIGLVGGLIYFFTQTERGRELWGQFVSDMQRTADMIVTFFIGMRDKIVENWRYLQNTLSGAWDAIVAGVSSLVESFIGFFTRLWETVTTIWNAIVSGFTAAFDAIVIAVQTVYDTFSSIWQAIVTVVTGAVDAVRTTVTSTVDNIKSRVSDAFSSLLSTVKRIWEGVKTAIEGPINRAKDVVRKAIDAIKGFFNFKFQWPHIPLPHFSISGSANPLDWITGGLPKISVQWYAKGGFVDGATLIGAGEKGGEFIWPSYGPYLKTYAKALSSEMGSDTRTVNNYYIDGSLITADAVLGAALDTVAKCVDARRRMGVA